MGGRPLDPDPASPAIFVSLSVVMGAALGDFLGAVDLFDDEKAGEGVRKDEFEKAPEKVSVLAEYSSGDIFW